MLIRTGKRCEEKWEGEKERVNTGIEALGADLKGQTNWGFSKRVSCGAETSDLGGTRGKKREGRTLILAVGWVREVARGGGWRGA